MTEQKTEPTVEYKNGAYWMTNDKGRRFVAEAWRNGMTIEADSPLRGSPEHHLSISESDLATLLRAMGWTVELPARERGE